MVDSNSMDVFDTNCFNNMSNYNKKCYITDVTLCELLKEKNNLEKRNQLTTILDYIEKTGSEFVFLPMNKEQYSKFERSKSENAAFYNLNKIAEDTYVRIAMMYLETVLAILLVLIHKKNGTEIDGDNLLIKRKVDLDTHKMCLALKKFYEEKLYPNKNTLFRRMYRRKDKHTMDEIGVAVINTMLEMYNKHISDETLKNMAQINKINQNELLKETYGKIDEIFIRKILESYFDYCKEDDPTYFVMLPYIKRVFCVSGKFEFNDVADYINVFAAKTLGCKFYTKEKKIVETFPGLAILAEQ